MTPSISKDRRYIMIRLLTRTTSSTIMNVDIAVKMVATLCLDLFLSGYQHTTFMTRLLFVNLIQ